MMKEQLFNYRKKELSGKALIVIGKILTFAVGLTCVAVAFLAQYLGGLLQVRMSLNSEEH